MQYLMDIPVVILLVFLIHQKIKLIKIKKGMSKWIGKEWLVLLQLL